MSSILLKRFIEEIKYENRNPRSSRVLELLDDTKTNTEWLIPAGTLFYRCRVIKENENDKIGVAKEKGFWGFNQADSFVAPKECTRDMRANYRFIPYLYIADNPRLAIYETRPRYGAKVSLATIEVKEPLRILDFTCTFSRIGNTTKNNLFREISECFSKPVTDEDDVIDYIPTQFIAEYAKKLGYDGIAYKSSLLRIGDVGTYGTNYTIFNYQKTEAVHSNVLRTDGVRYEFVKEDDDSLNPIDEYSKLIFQHRRPRAK